MAVSNCGLPSIRAETLHFPDPVGTCLTLEGEQQFIFLAVKWDFKPLDHNKQKCKKSPNNNHG